MNTASGAGNPASASGAWPCTMRRSGVPSAAALRAARAARSAPSSMPMALSDGWRSSHSIAIEPAPSPTSHSSSPCRGASAETVIARTSRLVSWPSCSNRLSSRPGARLSAADAAPTTSTAIVLSGVDRAEIEARGRRPPHALARPAHAFEHRHRRIAEAARLQERRQLGRRRRRPTTARGCARPAAGSARCPPARGHAG